MDLDVLAIDVRNLKALLTNITPLMPVLTKLAANPQLIEQLANDAGAVAKDVAALSAAVADNKDQVGALKSQLEPMASSVGQISALQDRIAALEAAARGTDDGDKPERPREPVRPQGWPGDDNQPAGGPDLGAGGES